MSPPLMLSFTTVAEPIQIAALVVAVTAVVLLVVGVPLSLLGRCRRHALQAGYSGLRPFLRSIPRTDAEKLFAVEMTLKGVVLCALGFLFPPLLLVGVFAFYYGARKLGIAWLGLEILDQGGQRTK